MNSQGATPITKEHNEADDGGAISGASRKRRARTAEDEMSKRKRLAHAMEELNLGTPASVSTEWGAPFGTRTRLRTGRARRRTREKTKEGDSLEFGASFKRALAALDADIDNHNCDTPGNPEGTPTKRRRDNKSRALVLYRGPSSPSNLIRSSSTSAPMADIWTALPYSLPKVIIEPPDDNDGDNDDSAVFNNNNSCGTMDVDEIIIAEDDEREWNRDKALIQIPPMGLQRRSAYLRAAKEASLVRTQTAILMPWIDNRSKDGDVKME